MGIAVPVAAFFIYGHYETCNGLYNFPPSIYSRDIANNIKAHKGKVTLLEKNYNKFVTAQMDETITDGGKTYTKPDKWK